MIFWYNYLNEDNNNHSSGKTIMVSDTSLQFEPWLTDIDFSILLAGNWRFSLEMNVRTKKCIAFTGFFNELECEIADLDILNSQKGELFFDDDTIEFVRGSGCHYEEFINKCYVDIEKNIIYIGKRNALGKIIEFANNTFAIINKSSLEGIFVKVSNNLKDFLKTYKNKNIVKFSQITSE